MDVVDCYTCGACKDGLPAFASTPSWWNRLRPSWSKWRWIHLPSDPTPTACYHSLGHLRTIHPLKWMRSCMRLGQGNYFMSSRHLTSFLFYWRKSSLSNCFILVAPHQCSVLYRDIPHVSGPTLDHSPILEGYVPGRTGGRQVQPMLTWAGLSIGV